MADVPARADKLTEEKVTILAGEGPEASVLDRAVTFRDLIALGLVTPAYAYARAQQRPAALRRLEGARD